MDESVWAAQGEIVSKRIHSAVVSSGVDEENKQLMKDRLHEVVTSFASKEAHTDDSIAML